MTKFALNHYVIYITAFTRSQAFPPEQHESRESAENAAKEYNRQNQDHTWNHVVAYAESVQNIPIGE